MTFFGFVPPIYDPVNFCHVNLSLSHQLHLITTNCRDQFQTDLIFQELFSNKQKKDTWANYKFKPFKKKD